MAEKKKKYYWLKLQKDFFKRHDIRIIESMPNGKDYILFYLKLLCESTSHEGSLRFSDEIPYDENMLATITNTNIDIVRSAIKLFTSLHMMNVLEDGTLFMQETNKLLGFETNFAQKKREYREAKALELEDSGKTMVRQCPTFQDNVRQEIEIELELEKDIYKRVVEKHVKQTKKFVKPTLEELSSFILENKLNVNVDNFFNYYESNGWKVGKNSMKNWQATLKQWHARERQNKPAKVDVLPSYYKKPIDWSDIDVDESYDPFAEPKV